MRLIDADALNAKGYILQRSYRKDDKTGVFEVKAIDEIPTIDPVKHGRWEVVYGDHISMGHRPWSICCSVCGRCGEETNYCPYCGAKMDGGEE